MCFLIFDLFILSDGKFCQLSADISTFMIASVVLKLSLIFQSMSIREYAFSNSETNIVRFSNVFFSHFIFALFFHLQSYREKPFFKISTWGFHHSVQDSVL